MIKKQPLLTIGSLITLIAAAINLLNEFGLHVSEGQETALLRFVSIAAPITVAAIGWGMVFAPASVKRMLAQAHAIGAAGGPLPISDTLSLGDNVQAPTVVTVPTTPAPEPAAPVDTTTDAEQQAA